MTSNSKPTATKVSAKTDAKHGIWVDLTNFDSDPDASDVLSVSGFGTTGTRGTPKLNPTGTLANGFAYSPGTAFLYLSAGETATDSFTYTISDGHGHTSTATATITVSGVNTAPVATIDRTNTDAGHAVTVNVLANDTDVNLHDKLTVASLNLTGTQGTAVLNADGTVTYTPGGSLTYLPVGKGAMDSFTYTVADGHGGTSTIPVQVIVKGTWEPPVAVANSATTDSAHPVTINVAANDTDPQSGVTLKVASVDVAGTNGSVVINANGTVTYTPGAAFNGLVAGTATTDSFHYTVSDGHGGTSTATVTVTVTAPGAASNAPQAVYVATNGNDAWSGLLAHPNAAGTDGPKATLQAAEVVMRNSATVKTAYIEEGDYYLSSSLTLGPQDAGQSWLAYPGQTPRIHGGASVTGWTQQANGIWTAQAPAGAFAAGNVATDLFYNGNREVLARYPNQVPSNMIQGGWLLAAPSLAGQNTTTSFQFNAGDVPTFSSTSGLYVDVYQQNGWQNYILPISSIDYTKHTITLGAAASSAIGQGSRYFIFNANSQLNATDEWYYNSGTNTISLRAPSGFTSSSNVVVGTLGNIVSIYNTSNITIAGLTITDSLNTGSGINIANSTGIDIAGNRIRNVGVGVSFSSSSHDDTIEGNQISQTASNGVQIPTGVNKINVLGNYIHDVGTLRASNGIWASGSSNDLFSNNLIKNSSKNGISIGASSAGAGSYNDSITYNEISNANQQTSDGGAIYINGQYQQDLTGDVVAFNKIYGTTAAGTVSNAGVASSTFLPTSQLNSFGIYLDDYASGVSVSNNLLYNNVSGVEVHSGWNNTVSNNFLVSNSGSALQAQAANALGAGIQASANNLFTKNLVSAGSSGLASINLGTTGNAQWTSNFYDSTTLATKSFAAFVASTYSAASIGTWESMGYDAGASSGNPGFVNKATGNYTLATGSPAFATGITNLPVNKMGLAGFSGGNAYDQTWGMT